VLKIFHGCDNDLVWLIRNFEIYTRNIFDTARAFVSFQKVIIHGFKFSNLSSLGYLIKFFFNTELDKSYQRSDWRIRPLTANMLQYALNDAKTVVYMFHLYIGLLTHLEAKYEFGGYTDYFDKLCLKFVEHNQKGGQEISKKKVCFILPDILITTYELMKAKIKDTYTKLSMENIN
jgi:ribonuclease D